MSVEAIERALTVRESIVVKAIASGIKESEAIKMGGWGPWAVHNPGQWLRDHPEVAAVVGNLRDEILFDAAEALRELIRGYAGLLIQEARLQSMLGHDIGDLYRLNGQLYPIEMWPAAWRKQLVVEIESQERSVRSHDGVTSEKQGGWDVIGEVRKFKRESTLAIEREIRQVKKEQRDQLELIMKHKAVDALASEKHDVNVSVVTAEQARRVAGARSRLNRVIDVTPTAISSGVQESTASESLLGIQQETDHNG